jgi:hypothetical protein
MRFNMDKKKKEKLCVMKLHVSQDSMCGFRVMSSMELLVSSHK